jgi:hypothetical protein
VTHGVLAAAFDEAAALGHHRAGCEHLLLAFAGSRSVAALRAEVEGQVVVVALARERAGERR